MPNILGWDTNPRLLCDASIRVRMLERKYLSIEKSVCLNEACCIKRFECSARAEKRYRRTKSIYHFSHSHFWTEKSVFFWHFSVMYFMEKSLNQHFDLLSDWNQCLPGRWLTNFRVWCVCIHLLMLTCFAPMDSNIFSKRTLICWMLFISTHGWRKINQGGSVCKQTKHKWWILKKRKSQEYKMKVD